MLLKSKGKFVKIIGSKLEFYESKDQQSKLVKLTLPLLPTGRIKMNFTTVELELKDYSFFLRLYSKVI